MITVDYGEESEGRRFSNDYVDYRRGERGPEVSK